MTSLISSIIPLPNLSPGEALPNTASGINNSAQVVGTILTPSVVAPGLWLRGIPTVLPLLSGDTFGAANAINNDGQIAGYSSTDDSSSGLDVSHATLWQNGAVTALGTLGGAMSLANAINDLGQVVGVSTTAGGVDEAFLWQNGLMIDLGTLPGGASVSSGGFPNSVALGINTGGQVVGHSLMAGSLGHAFLWQNGIMTDLGTLSGGVSSSAGAIDNSGEAVGFSATASGITLAVSWQNGVISNLGTLPGDDYSVANAINSAGVIVGESANATNGTFSHAVMWQNGAIIDLNSLLPANSGWLLADATGINDNGQIIGDGFFNGYSNETEFVLTLGTTPVRAVTAQSAEQSFQNGLLSSAVAVADSAAHVQAGLDQLQAIAAVSKIEYIALTDAGTPEITVSPAQLDTDYAALQDITGTFALAVDASLPNLNLSVLLHGHGTVAVFSGAAHDYSVATSLGGGLTLTDTGTGRSSTDSLYNVTALQFSDVTVIVAQTPGTTTVTTGNIAELYGAAFGREPDVAGLAYYQDLLFGNPQLPLTNFAQWFLASPEYADNPAHDYAQTTAGETQFITATYNNLLHRAPEASAVPYYLNVISQFTSGLTPGTSAYAKADSLAHAYVLTYFSASAEFLSDVQVTAANPSSAQHWLILT